VTGCLQKGDTDQRLRLAPPTLLQDYFNRLHHMYFVRDGTTAKAFTSPDPNQTLKFAIQGDSPVFKALKDLAPNEVALLTNGVLVPNEEFLFFSTLDGGRSKSISFLSSVGNIVTVIPQVHWK